MLDAKRSSAFAGLRRTSPSSVIGQRSTQFHSIKEWAYAGFGFIFMLAFASRAFAKDGTVELIAPLIMLAYLLVVYYLWKKQWLLIKSSSDKR